MLQSKDSHTPPTTIVIILRHYIKDFLSKHFRLSERSQITLKFKWAGIQSMGNKMVKDTDFGDKCI